MNRRNLAFAAVGLTAMAACTQQQQDQLNAVQKQIAAAIQTVQSAVAVACAQYGKVVPTVDTVIAVVSSIVGAVAPDKATLLVATASVLKAAADEIVAVGCPPPSPAPTAAQRTSKGVQVSFY